MNKQRRNSIRKEKEKLENVISDIEQIYDEECEARDGFPESLMDTERYEKSEESCDTLESVIDSLSEIVEELEEICN